MDKIKSGRWNMVCEENLYLLPTIPFKNKVGKDLGERNVEC
jgi:hypothetical protein